MKIIYYIFGALFLLTLIEFAFPVFLVISIVMLILFGLVKYFEVKEKQEEQEEAERRRQEIEAEQREYEEALKNAKNAYEQALDGTDKRDALKKGKVYYALLQNGIPALSEDYTENLSRRDQEKIRLDIESMNV